MGGGLRGGGLLRRLRPPLTPTLSPLRREREKWTAPGVFMQAPALETHGLTIRFGGHVAVNNVSAAYRAGTLTAIVGPNGAGKTTYINLVSGQLPATSGSVFVR